MTTYEPYHEPYPLMDMATAPQDTSQYPPQLPQHGTHLSQGSYGTAVGDPLAQKTIYDSPNPNAPLPLGNDTQPFLPLNLPHRRSGWRAIILRSRRFARFTYATCLLIVLVVWAVINVAFTIRERDHQMRYSTGDLQEKGAVLLQQNRDQNQTLFIFMKGHLRGYDPNKSMLSVEWEGLLVDAQRNDLHLGSTPDVLYILAIFRDVATIRDLETEARLKTVDPSGPVASYSQYRVLPPAPPPVGFIGRTPGDSISTDISVGQTDDATLWTQPNFAYPYDESQGQIRFAMTDNFTANYYNTSLGTFAVPIMGAVITDVIMNYQIDISNNVACLDLDETCHLDITLEIQRPGLVKAVVILTVIINWLITLSICVLTGEAILLQRVHILNGSDILSICLTSLFALPSVRSVLPGAPPFGCLLDMVGILPNLILISICTAAFAVAKAKNRPREDVQLSKLEE